MKVLFFDGYCSLCNGLVDWLIARDSRKNLKFASLQGDTAKTILPPEELNFNLNGIDPDTVIYSRDGVTYKRSSAILAALQDLGGAWKLTAIFSLIPLVFRDGIYKLVAKNRYRLFGKRDTCRLPSTSEKERLLP